MRVVKVEHLHRPQALLADVKADIERWESYGFTYRDILREIATQGEYAPLYTAVWVQGNRARKLRLIAATYTG